MEQAHPRPDPRIGVLALQGDFAAHAAVLAGEGAAAAEVRLPAQLERLDGLILPGGESTTMLRLLREYGFDEAIPAFVARGGALFGTCAGAILLAARVVSPEQWSFGLIDIDVERNAFGRQIDSFEAQIVEAVPDVLAGGRDPYPAPSVPAEACAGSASGMGARASHVRARAEGPALPPRRSAPQEELPGGPVPSLEAAFIRAPRILRTGEGVSVLARLDGEPVLVRQGRVLASTFHPEIAGEPRVHRYFLENVMRAR